MDLPNWHGLLENTNRESPGQSPFRLTWALQLGSIQFVETMEPKVDVVSGDRREMVPMVPPLDTGTGKLYQSVAAFKSSKACTRSLTIGDLHEVYKKNIDLPNWQSLPLNGRPDLQLKSLESKVEEFSTLNPQIGTNRWNECNFCIR